jgi:hypothetical protein
VSGSCAAEEQGRTLHGREAEHRHVRCEPTSHASRGKWSNRGQIVVKQRSNLRAEAAERALEPPPVRDLARTRTQKPPRTPPPPTAHPSRSRPPARRTHPPLPPHTHPHTPLSSLPARTGPGRTPAVGQGAGGWKRLEPVWAVGNGRKLNPLPTVRNGLTDRTQQNSPTASAMAYNQPGPENHTRLCLPCAGTRRSGTTSARPCGRGGGAARGQTRPRPRAVRGRVQERAGLASDGRCGVPATHDTGQRGLAAAAAPHATALPALVRPPAEDRRRASRHRRGPQPGGGTGGGAPRGEPPLSTRTRAPGSRSAEGPVRLRAPGSRLLPLLACLLLLRGAGGAPASCSATRTGQKARCSAGPHESSAEAWPCSPSVRRRPAGPQGPAERRSSSRSGGPSAGPSSHYPQRSGRSPAGMASRHFPPPAGGGAVLKEP